jgi:hypothetical protein
MAVSKHLGIALAAALCALCPAAGRADSIAEPTPGPVWPPDCTRDMPRDGLLLLDAEALADSGGALQVRLVRSADGGEVKGDFDDTRALPRGLRAWRSQEPLAPDTEYRVELGQAASAEQRRISYFTTGEAFLAPLAFSARPALRLIAREPAADAPDSEPVLLRVALPALSGGLPQRPLHVAATLDEEGAAQSDARDVRPGQPLTFEFGSELTSEPRELCVEISAQDDLGQALRLDPPLCVSLPARSHPPELAARTLDAASASEDAAASTSESAAPEPATSQAAALDSAPASGCSISPASSSGLASTWPLLLALVVRRRKILPG